jgi:hypothetical protein
MSAHGPLSPESLVLDQLRSRWLHAIIESGPAAARNEAVIAFMQRMSCTRETAEDLVERAWSILNLNVHVSHARKAA